jgi:hypothetical protein
MLKHFFFWLLTRHAQMDEANFPTSSPLRNFGARTSAALIASLHQACQQVIDIALLPIIQGFPFTPTPPSD